MGIKSHTGMSSSSLRGKTISTQTSHYSIHMILFAVSTIYSTIHANKCHTYHLFALSNQLAELGR